jgi:hypothetical protein
VTYCDFEPPSFYIERMLTAKKSHVCIETGLPIHKGERYWRCSGKWEGSFLSFVQSDFAYRFARKLNGADPYDRERQLDGCISFGGVADHVHEFRNDLPSNWVEEWDHHVGFSGAK